MSGFCGVYSPADPALASEAILTRMMRASDHPNRREQRRHLDAVAGVAIGYLYQPAFMAPDQAPEPAWLTGDVVVALEGSLNASSSVTQEQADSSTGSVEAIGAMYGHDAGFPKALDGYFSFALWDATARRVCLVNDRLNNRTFYYYRPPGQALFVFASELKAILEHPSVGREVDAEALVTYMARGYVPAPLCLFRGIRKAMPGEVVSFDSDGRLDARTYWQAAPPKRLSSTLDEWGEATRVAITEALARISKRTPRIGVQFSGGVDSSIVAAALRDAGNSHVECFTIAWPDLSGSDDAAWSRQVAELLGLKHHILEAGPPQITPELTSRLMRQFDEPIDSAARCVGLHILSEAAHAAGFDSIIDGNDGEQLFVAPVGSEVGEGEALADGGLKKLEDNLIEGRYFSHGQLLRTLLEPPEGFVACMQSFVYGVRHLVPADDPPEVFSSSYYLRQPRGRFGLFGELIPALSGVESRRGFRDYGLFEFSRTMPNEIKGSKKGGTARQVLKAAFGAEVPAIIERTEKRASPGTFALSPNLEPYFLDLARRSENLGLFHPEAIRRLVQRAAGNPDSGAGERFRALSMFLVWHAFYIEGRDPFEETIKA